MASWFDLNQRDPSRGYTDAANRPYQEVGGVVGPRPITAPTAGSNVIMKSGDSGVTSTQQGDWTVYSNGIRVNMKTGERQQMLDGRWAPVATTMGGGVWPRPAGGAPLPYNGPGSPGFTGGVAGSAGSGQLQSSGQDPRAFLQSLAQGGKLTPQQLTAAIPQLQQMGVRVLGANSEGIQSKIQLPNGQVIDLIKDAGGENRFQWLNAGGGGGGGGMAGGGGGSLGMLGGGALPPGYWTGQQTGGGRYPLASAGGPGLAQPWLTPFQSPGDFTPPNVTDDPGFKFRMQEGQKALERSAAARGTLLTGGTLKDLANYSQGLASQEYGNAYNRALGQNELKYGRALGEYGLAYDIYNQNNNNLYNRLSNLAGLGQMNTGNLEYANQAGNLITGAGNAQAAGTVGSANAWGQALGGLANQAPLWMQLYQQQRNPVIVNATGGSPGGYGGYPSNI